MKNYTLAFDIDGTLADTSRDILYSLEMTLKSEGMNYSLKGIEPYVSDGAIALIKNATGMSFADDAPRLLYLRDQFIINYQNNICNKTILYPNVKEVLSDLFSLGFRLVICTNKSENLASLLLQRLSIQNYFEVVCGRNTFDFCKPDPRHLTEAIKIGGGDPKAAIFVGDSEVDAETAKSANIPFIAVTFGYSKCHVSDLGAKTIISSYLQLKPEIDRLIY